MSNHIIIHKDGSVIPLEGAYLVDLDNLDPIGQKLWDEWNASGNDEFARDLTAEGKDLNRVLSNIGHGDLNYGNAISFSPEGLREEFQAKLDSGVWDDDPAYQRALKFTDEELEAYGSYILGQDYIWNVYNEEINHNLRPFIAEVLNEDIK